MAGDTAESSRNVGSSERILHYFIPNLHSLVRYPGNYRYYSLSILFNYIYIYMYVCVCVCVCMWVGHSINKVNFS